MYGVSTCRKVPTGIEDADIQRAAQALAEHCRTRHLRVAVAESCTGGGLAKACTDLPGSSDWFDSGWVVYSNDAKIRLLGVDRELLTTHGAVSAHTVEALAAGVLQRTRCDRVCAISGVAGPAGGTARTPVGCVWFGFAGTDRAVCSERQDFAGDRDAVRRQSVLFGLQRLAE